MAAKKNRGGGPKKQSFAEMQQSISKQFQGLNMNDPGQWPLAPRVAAYIFVVVIVVVLAWFLVLAGKKDEWTRAQGQELTLKDDFSRKAAQAANLPRLQQQQQEVQKYVEQLEQQLPSKAYMDQLLMDINAAGINNHLEFDKLQSEERILQEYYAEQPISISAVAPNYQQIALFAAELARLSRIVTLDNITLESLKSSSSSSSSRTSSAAGGVPLDAMRITATLKTYRYLDADEVRLNRQAAAGNRR